MLIEDQYGVGDVIDVGEATGVVEEVNLRTTRLRDVNGTVWIMVSGSSTPDGMEAVSASSGTRFGYGPTGCTSGSTASESARLPHSPGKRPAQAKTPPIGIMEKRYFIARHFSTKMDRCHGPLISP